MKTLVLVNGVVVRIMGARHATTREKDGKEHRDFSIEARLPPNTEAAGGRIFARIGDTEQMREIMIGSNDTSQNPTVQIFGLDSSTTVDALGAEWPHPALPPPEGAAR